jgi:hypothetical protein
MQVNKKTELILKSEEFEPRHLAREHRIGWSALEDILQKPQEYFPGFGATNGVQRQDYGKNTVLRSYTSDGIHEYNTFYRIKRPGLAKKWASLITGKEPSLSIYSEIQTHPTASTNSMRAWNRDIEDTEQKARKSGNQIERQEG